VEILLDEVTNTRMVVGDWVVRDSRNGRGHGASKPQARPFRAPATMPLITVLVLACQVVSADPPAQTPSARAAGSGSESAAGQPEVAAEPAREATPHDTVEDAMHRRHPLRTHGTGLGRWVDVSSSVIGVRYRSQAFDARPAVHQIQAMAALRGRVKLDGAGRYALHGGVSTGRGRGGWNTTGIGAGPLSNDVSLREFFVSAALLDGRVALHVGGLHLLRGEATEATTYDNDGSIIGERVSVRPGALVDDVSLTRAYLGDLSASNVVTRLERLDRANYYQLSASRHAGRAKLSADYTSHDGTHVLRGGLNLDLVRFTLLDRAHFEHYVRVSPEPSYGFAVSALRRLGDVATASAGFSSIDRRVGTLNGDLYGSGPRVAGSLSRRVGRAWIASVQLARGLGGQDQPGPRTRVDLALAYDIVSAVRGVGRR
jgi:hypothetical protein